MDWLDKEKTKHHAKKEAEQLYDQSYGALHSELRFSVFVLVTNPARSVLQLRLRARSCSPRFGTHKHFRA